MIDISKPYLFILIIFMICFTFYFGMKQIRGSNIKKVFMSSLRSLVLCFIILSMCGISLNIQSNVTENIVAIDMSSSTQISNNEIETIITNINRNLGEKDKIGAVVFGNDASVEKNLSGDKLELNISSKIDTNQTDISKALDTSYSLMEKGGKKRIILISDGIETKSDAISTARNLSSQGVQISAVALTGNEKEEVQISDLKVPKKVNKSNEFSLQADIYSTYSGEVTLKLYKNNNIIFNDKIDVTTGENKFMFSDVADKGGSIVYRAVIESDRDNFTENNTFYGFTNVEDIQSILIIKNSNGETQSKKILSSSGLNIVEVKADSAPESIDVLNQYDGIIIDNTPYDAFPKGFINSINTYVKELGKGVMVLGGDKSYGLGGYKNTVLEEILPVEMDVKTDGENPSLCMIMVIDQSGSMSDGRYGISKMEMAKEAAIRGLESLTDDDYIGVVAFDNNFSWVVEVTKVEGQKQQIADKISSIGPMGGTSILPALNEANKVIQNVNSKLKHIILLTDGQAEQNGYSSVINSMRNTGVTLSTVAVGSGADTALLEDLAEQGNGRYYFSNEFSDLPEIFAKETFLAGKEYINERSFYPQVKDYSNILDGVDKVTALNGYISTSAKPRADVILQTDKEEPLLASWQYGLGRTIAWTSDLNGLWTEEFLSSDEVVNIFKNSVSWLLSNKISSDIDVSAFVKDDKGNVRIELPKENTGKIVSADIISWDGKSYTTNLETIAPNVYEGSFLDTRQGAYIINIKMEDKDGKISVFSSGFNFPYSKEFNISDKDSGIRLLNQITDIGNGVVADNIDEIFSKDIEVTKASKDISSILLVIGLILFLVDVAIRRFSFIMDKIEKLILKFSNKKVLDKKEVKTIVNEVKEEKNKKEVEVEVVKEEVKKENDTSSTLLKGKQQRRR